MKGPNAKLDCVDFLSQKVKPATWRNVPLPMVDAVEEIVSVFQAFKKLYHDNYNLII